jgi:hypothetical protein
VTTLRTKNDKMCVIENGEKDDLSIARFSKAFFDIICLKQFFKYVEQQLPNDKSHDWKMLMSLRKLINNL